MTALSTLVDEKKLKAQKTILLQRLFPGASTDNISVTKHYNTAFQAK